MRLSKSAKRQKTSCVSKSKQTIDEWDTWFGDHIEDHCAVVVGHQEVSRDRPADQRSPGQLGGWRSTLNNKGTIAQALNELEVVHMH